MTIIESFVSFAKGLPADKLEAVEAGLAALLDSYSARYEFGEGELAELDRRVAEPAPRFAVQQDIEAIFGNCIASSPRT